MKAKLILTLLTFTASLNAMASGKELEIDRGRYLVRTTGCNDCHTPMYGPANGDVPEKDWLIGVAIGWKGPWGTTYAANLRKRAAAMTEAQWLTYFKNIKTRPPMPYYSLNAMNDADILAIYKFVRHLGDHDQVIPDALPPGETPKTPYFDFDLKMPKQQKGPKGAAL